MMWWNIRCALKKLIVRRSVREMYFAKPPHGTVCIRARLKQIHIKFSRWNKMAKFDVVYNHRFRYQVGAEEWGHLVNRFVSYDSQDREWERIRPVPSHIFYPSSHDIYFPVIACKHPLILQTIRTIMAGKKLNHFEFRHKVTSLNLQLIARIPTILSPDSFLFSSSRFSDDSQHANRSIAYT